MLTDLKDFFFGIINDEKRDTDEMWFPFSFPQKEKKQQIIIATEAAQSCVLVWSKKRSFFDQKILDYLNAFKPVISMPVINK